MSKRVGLKDIPPYVVLFIDTQKLYIRHDTLGWVDFSRLFPRTPIEKSRFKDDEFGTDRGTDNHTSQHNQI